MSNNIYPSMYSNILIWSISDRELMTDFLGLPNFHFWMQLPRRVPWASITELDEVCAWIYTDESDHLTKGLAVQRVRGCSAVLFRSTQEIQVIGVESHHAVTACFRIYPWVFDRELAR
jgi:hypothetical protein